MHYMLLVELPPEALVSESAFDLLNKAMEPFNSDCDGGHPNDDDWDGTSDLRCGHKSHEWDWWELGGRYTDFFQAVREPTEVPIQGEDAASRFNRYLDRTGSTLTREKVPVREGYDLIRKRDVDWEAMAAKHERDARRWWAEAVAKRGAGDVFAPLWEYGIEEGDTEETYLARQRQGRTFAILTADGRWIERETFVFDPDGKSRFDTDPNWPRHWDEHVAAMPADAVLAIVDYHN